MRAKRGHVEPEERSGSAVGQTRNAAKAACRPALRQRLSVRRDLSRPRRRAGLALPSDLAHRPQSGRQNHRKVVDHPRPLVDSAPTRGALRCCQLAVCVERVELRALAGPIAEIRWRFAIIDGCLAPAVRVALFAREPVGLFVAHTARTPRPLLRWCCDSGMHACL
jgi:hypothetical protein